MASSFRLSVRVPAVALTFEKKQLKKTLRRAGAEVASVAKALILRASGGGRKYGGPGGSAARYRGGYKPGAYTASAAGAPPISVTGFLARSIKVRPFKNGDGVAICDTQFYAKFLETGAVGGGYVGGGFRSTKGGRRVKAKSGKSSGRVLRPHPFLSTALDQRQASLTSRLIAAATQDIEFKRIKA